LDGPTRAEITIVKLRTQQQHITQFSGVFRFVKQKLIRSKNEALNWIVCERKQQLSLTKPPESDDSVPLDLIPWTAQRNGRMASIFFLVFAPKNVSSLSKSVLL
jgi:hypothetical protein